MKMEINAYEETRFNQWWSSLSKSLNVYTCFMPKSTDKQKLERILKEIPIPEGSYRHIRRKEQLKTITYLLERIK